MKLERLPEYITIVITIACGMLLALYVGVSTGSGSTKPLMLIGAIVAITVALVLRANIWLLIPLGTSLSGSIPGASIGGLALRHELILYTFAVFLTLKALKVVRAKLKYDWLDWLLWINLAYLATAYIRNPVGTLSLGFEKIGGKPYVEVIIALFAYWVLNHITLSPKLAFRMPILLIAGSLFDSFARLVGALLPPVGAVLGNVYTSFRPGIADADTMSSAPRGEGEGVTRETGQQGGGMGIIKALCSYFPPLSLLNPLHYIRLILLALGLFVIMRSGFRSALLSTGLFFLLATYFRNGAATTMRIPFLAAPVLLFMILFHGTAFELPLSVQRSLSFIPADWNPAVKMSADDSVEWRFQIWENVWKSGNKYIKNWWLGDGFGLTRRDLQEATMARIDETQENLSIVGDFHSLPLSTIRVVGYVGLALLMVQLSAMSYYAWKLIRRAQGTPYFPVALFIGIPIVWDVLYGPLVFGAYNYAAPTMVYSVAWLRLISRSLDVYLGNVKEQANQPAPFPELPISPFPRQSQIS